MPKKREYAGTPEIISGKIKFTHQLEPVRGPKDTTGKTDWSVFPFAETEEVVYVFKYGAQKYGEPFTYRRGIPVE